MMHAVINHLWQSTVFAIVAGLLTLAFRRNRAQVRYWLWFSASVKFLVPFALLLSLGGYLGRSPVAKSLPLSAISYAVVQLAEPFPVHTPAAPPAQMPPQAPIDWIPIVLVSLWMCGFLGVTLSRVRAWLRIRAALRLSTPLEICFPTPVRSTTHLLEPGVIGFFRPRLLLPMGIRERLTPEQLQGVLTHELCHLRRRDNLTAVMHTVVEALFWFHPLVWWISARLMEERECACDEAVLESGGEPQVYAESILKICQLCVESPLACVPGIAGADLKKRVVRIMTHRGVLRVDVRRKFLLAVAGLLAIAVPIGFGLASVEPGQANSGQTLTSNRSDVKGATSPSFEVASISVFKGNSIGHYARVRITNPVGDGRFYATNVTLRMLIRLAYGIQDPQIVGEPDWINHETFDIQAKADDSVNTELEKLSSKQAVLVKQRMLQALLRDRFDLKVHRETKRLPFYALIVAKNGAKLHQTETEKSLTLPISSLVSLLSLRFGRKVVDETGLNGRYAFTLRALATVKTTRIQPGAVEPVEARGVVTGDASEPSIFTVLQQQFGLRLKPEKGPVEVLVIDHIELPTPN